MAKSEGINRLFEPISSIDTDILEVFPYQMKEVVYTPNQESHCEIVEDLSIEHIKQKVTYQTEELSAVCPFSGLPDIAKLKIEYIPNKNIMELKSLKYYLMSFRNVGIYQEHLTQRIYSDLKKVLNPLSLTVETIYNTRGGIDSTCQISSAEQVTPPDAVK